MFEIISSQHLEISSMEAERERNRQRAKELEKDGKSQPLARVQIAVLQFVSWFSHYYFVVFLRTFLVSDDRRTSNLHFIDRFLNLCFTAFGAAV